MLSLRIVRDEMSGSCHFSFENQKMKEFLRKYKRDFYLAGGILLGSLLILLLMGLNRKIGTRVVVCVDGAIIDILPLYENTEKDYETEYGRNHLVIQNGKAFVTDSDCRDQICIREGEISKDEESIICLPHKMIIYIEAAD